MNRLTDNDKHFGPITYGKINWKAYSISIHSSDVDNDSASLIGYAGRYVFRITLGKYPKPYRHLIKTNNIYDLYRYGERWYIYPKKYGFMFNNDSLSLYYGPQTNDSITTKEFTYFMPWRQWRYLGIKYYDENGNLLFDCPSKMDYQERHNIEQIIPKISFRFLDFDGEEIVATTHIEQREWAFGKKWCSWLSVFKKNRIRRSLDIAFSAEVGKEKGSWKGGTIGHSIDMNDGELHESAFKRYCEKYNLKYIGKIDRV